MEDVRGITIRFPKDLHAKLRHRSVDSGVSVNQMVLAAIAEYLEREAEREKASSYL